MATGDLVTLPEVREYLGIVDAEETESDNYLSGLITTATKFINRYCGVVFVEATGSTTKTFAYTKNGRLDLVPFQFQYGSLTLVEIDTDETAQALTANDDYYEMPRGGTIDGMTEYLQLVNTAVGSKGWREVEVTGTMGFDVTPTEVKHACKCLVAHWFHSSSVPSRDMEGVSDRFGATVMPTIVRQILAPFRHHSFG